MNNTSNIVYLNGRYLPREQASVPVMDRGFLFGDGVYEVIPVFGGNMLRLEGHMSRLQNSLQRICLTSPFDDSEWRAIFDNLLDKNPGEDRAIYLQVSRGVYMHRDLNTRADGDVERSPTVFVMVLQLSQPDIDVSTAGISAVTLKDFRWDACEIKSTSLVANVILRRQANDVGANDAILIKNGVVTEGTASNVFIVKDNVIITPPVGNQLLSGITRDLVLEIAGKINILVEQRDIMEEELCNADEIWMTSSTREIAPVTRLNGSDVGSGRAGTMWKQIVDLYQQYKQNLRQQQVT